MRNNLRFLVKILSFAMLGFLASCSDDDDNNNPAPVNENPGTSLANGFYIVGPAIGADSTAGALVSGKVEAPNFSSQGRSGLFEGYVFMGSGEFSFVQVQNGEITNFGGTTEDTPVSDDVPMFTGSFTEDGAATTSPITNQLVHILIDVSTNQYFILPINSWEIIGDPTPGGFGSGTQLPLVSASAEEVVFQGTQIPLTSGSYKFRYNSNWNVNLDANCDNSAEACLFFFTNFGGSLTEFEQGGQNLTFDGDPGVYTITLTYKPGKGISFEAEFERTGDSAPVTFDPNDYQMGVLGTATAKGFDADRNMFYLGLDQAGLTGHVWAGITYLKADGEIKFRTNDAWDFNLGAAATVELGTPIDLTRNGDNITGPAADGVYYILLSTPDEGTTWSTTITEGTWGVIGDATPTGWESDTDTESAGFDAEGLTTYTLKLDLTASGAYKIRAADDWALNLGATGDAEPFLLDAGADPIALARNGKNISINADGETTVTLTFDGDNYTLSVSQ